ncbi:CDP-alcohol phosphatidyltransferase family protein [Pseudomarimonas salicorniae]|uniref:CDP-diacylglycerol--glycerol-3-phosphate 3-phosphatidyltransferase n=1 Tax=Pseudomarimonas salicorniae TaxID=2933270 RepID=A0ABT0GGK9_9GAMM|nr:CDP-alcohol phosphatidyltransferase family protein [Lysobacter sp. CAU 1642]MCK7593678.1 CDP-alcohol phosphatidyltransferase family protein [Lysobacter sp. CAU 1642]
MIWRQIPNGLTALRILLVPLIVLQLLQRDFALAAVLFAVAALSDGLDGLLARRFGWQTRLGGLLDPLADKLLVNACFGSLWWLGEVPGWLPALVLARDAVIVAGAVAYHWRVAALDAAPTLLGKATTVAQTGFLWFAMIDLGLDRSSSPWWPWGVGVVIALIAASGIDYVVRWTRRAREARPSRSEP